jgi:hypothetical protein
MKYVLEVSNVKVVLSHTQLEIIAEAVSGSPTLANKYSSTKQPNGSNYTQHIEMPLLHEWFKPTVIEDDYVDTLVLAAKLQAE